MIPAPPRPLQTEDLDTCDACGAPATSWADGPGRVAVGCCSAACRRLIEERARGERPS